MITTGASPEAAVVMTNLKNHFGKSVSKGICSLAGKAGFPMGDQMDKAVKKGYHRLIRNMAVKQCFQEQK